MTAYNRKNFLRSLLLAGFGSALHPTWANALTRALPIPATPGPAVPGTAVPGPAVPSPHKFEPNDFGIIDLHCHPSLKMYLWGRKLWKLHTAGLGINAIDLQDDMEQLTSGEIPGQPGEGFVKGIVVAHYLPEEAIKEQWDELKKLYPWIRRLFKNFAGKLEHGDSSNFVQINQIIDELETQVLKTKQKKKDAPFVVARSYREFRDAIAQNKFPIAHAIEGAHALGRNASGSIDHRRRRKPQQGRMILQGQDHAATYLRNLELLKNRGVCMMTLAHFFPNDIAYCVEGISPDEKHSVGMQWFYTPEQDLPLTPVGETVVNWMLDNGMIIDLTHSTPAARDQVFARNLARAQPRPIVFTHTGAQKVFNDHDTDRFPNYGYYCVSQRDIANICACDGTIGIIPEVFWLAGGDTRLRGQWVAPKLYRNGIPYMVETIKYINSQTPDKDYRHISIGTDFDGLADDPQDLYEATQLDALIEALLAAGISQAAVKMIMSENALRVLENGWV